MKQLKVISQAELDAMNPAQKRVVLAEDVLAKIETQRMIVREGATANGNGAMYVYFDGLREFARNDFPSMLDDDAQEFFKDKVCTVCAKGSLLVAAIDRFDKVKIGEVFEDRDCGFSVDGTNDAKAWLEEFLEEDQMTLMEAAFECDANCSTDTSDMFASLCEEEKLDHDEPSDQEAIAELPISIAAEFGDQFDSAQERMEAIMKNVIANKGEFIPTLLKEEETT